MNPTMWLSGKPEYGEMRQRIQRVLGLNPAAVFRHDLGGHGFAEIADYFDRFRAMLTSFVEVNLMFVPGESFQEIHEAMKAAESAFDEMQQFRWGDASSETRRVQLVDRFVDAYKRVYRIALPIAADGRFQDLDSRHNQIESQFAKISALQKRAEEKLAEGVVQANATMFDVQAVQHEKAARCWLLAMGASVVLLFVGGWMLYKDAMEFERSALRVDNTVSAALTTAAVQVAIGRVVLLSLFATAAIWIGRVYKAQKHNAIVNRHRSHALANFRDFAEASDPEVKRAVLIQATQCIFLPQHTGFIVDEPDTVVASTLLEFAKGSTSK